MEKKLGIKRNIFYLIHPGGSWVGSWSSSFLSSFLSTVQLYNFSGAACEQVPVLWCLMLVRVWPMGIGGWLRVLRKSTREEDGREGETVYEGWITLIHPAGSSSSFFSASSLACLLPGGRFSFFSTRVTWEISADLDLLHNAVIVGMIIRGREGIVWLISLSTMIIRTYNQCWRLEENISDVRTRTGKWLGWGNISNSWVSMTNSYKLCNPSQSKAKLMTG